MSFHRVLFLDVDGVLNSFAWWRRREKKDIFLSHREHSLHQIDPEAVSRLNKIVDRTSGHVVLSSSWRILYSLDMMQGLLRERGFRHQLIGTTPRLSGQPRGHEIQAWLDSVGGADYVAILDDDSDMAHLRPRHVKTDMEDGLTDAHVELAVRLLT